MSGTTALAVLSSSLDQLGDLLVHVDGEALDKPTPCSSWTLGDLADHVVAAPGKFAVMARGEQPDWSASPPHLEEGWSTAFRSSADDLMHLLHQAAGDGDGPGPEWQTAEFAVHTWDLARALGRSTDDLDPEVAEQGLAFMKANLKTEMRGEAFGPEQPAPTDGDAYDAIAAFAGRTVSA
jgi:uncharacterized protein (TIGR03086 family)